MDTTGTKDTEATEANKVTKVTKQPNVALQAGAAVVLVVGALGAMWGLGAFGHSPRTAVACAPAKAGDGPDYPAMCAALNRRDLPVLLGTPTEVASVAYSTGGQAGAGQSGVEVQVGTYDVDLTEEKQLSVKDFTQTFALSSCHTGTVLGHPAVTYSDHTMAISLSGGQSSTGTGGIAEHLLVAKSAKDGGGAFELVIYRQDGQTPDATALLRIAQQVLPHLPGWVAAQ